ncbi:MAG: SMR family transporter, partial [Rhodococcus sp. (in: high G+C Gram-positive bacteria)]
MAWIVLVLSGVLEAVWATALGKSDGFTRLWPTVIFGVTV